MNRLSLLSVVGASCLALAMGCESKSKTTPSGSSKAGATSTDPIKAVTKEAEKVKEGAGTSIKEAVKEAGKEIKDKTKDAEKGIKDAVKDAGKEIKDKVKDAEKGIKDKAKDAEKGIKDKVDEAKDKVKEEVKDAADAASKLKEAAKKKFIDALAPQLATIDGKIKALTGDAKTAAEAKRKVVTELLAKLTSANADTWEGLKAGLEKALDELKALVSK